MSRLLRGVRDKQKRGTDYVYGVYLGLMFGNKCFDVAGADNIIIDSIRYASISKTNIGILIHGCSNQQIQKREY